VLRGSNSGRRLGFKSRPPFPNPDLRHTTQRATSVAHLTIASDRSRKADAKADFFSCEAWALLAEQVNENFAKGDFVRVTGYVKLDEYEVNGEKRRTATIVARKVEKVERTEAQAELDAQPAE
jgi:single-strand DNA-binding protein